MSATARSIKPQSCHLVGLPEQTQEFYFAVDRLSRNLPKRSDSQIATVGIRKMCELIQSRWSHAERQSRVDGRSLQELDTFRASIAPEKEFSWDTAERKWCINRREVKREQVA